MPEKKCICNEPYDSERHEGGYPYCPVHDKAIELTEQSRPVWVKASERLPLHKAFWNMPGEHNNNECYFPVRIDGHKYRVGEIYDERQAGAPDPIYMFVINGEDFYEKDFHRIEWLCETNEQPVVKIDREWVNDAMVGFALLYHKSTNKDIANDAAEYLDDKLKDAGIVYVLSDDEQPVEQKENEAVAFGRWLQQENYKPYAGQWYKNGNHISNSGFAITHLYELYQKQNKQ